MTQALFTHDSPALQFLSDVQTNPEVGVPSSQILSVHCSPQAQVSSLRQRCPIFGSLLLSQFKVDAVLP